MQSSNERPGLCQDQGGLHPKCWFNFQYNKEKLSINGADEQNDEQTTAQSKKKKKKTS